MKQLLIITILTFSFFCVKESSAQTGGVNPDGVYVPRVTTAKRDLITNPVEGQMIYNINDNCFNLYQRNTWQKLCGSSEDFTGEWTQKEDFGGTKRTGAIGFGIGDKAYIGLGTDANILKNDFWEYNPVYNIWTQKANFGGGVRANAVGFSIDNKGYVGTGNSDVEYKNDLWEYNPATNTWVQKANFGGEARNYAVGFAMGTKGYIGTGGAASGYKKDFWEYNPANNIWTEKANFGGAARSGATGFSLNGKGYIGTGVVYQNIYNDFWEYNPGTDSWTQKAYFAGEARFEAFGFSIKNQGYIGGGTTTRDFWEYTPLSNSWARRADFPGNGKDAAVGFTIGDKGYVGTGISGLGGITTSKEFWEYDPNASNITTQGNTFNGSNQLIKSDQSGNLNFTGNILTENFIAPILLNNWANFSNGYALAAFYKDKQSIVHLKGLLKDGITTTGTSIFTLPAGYRPNEIMTFVVVNGPSTFARVDVYTNGEVRLISGSNASLSLDGILFRVN